MTNGSVSTNSTNCVLLNKHLKDLRDNFGFEIDSLYPIQRTSVEGSRYGVIRGETETASKTCAKCSTPFATRRKRLADHALKGWRNGPEELRETTLDPNNRTLVQVTMDGVEAATTCSAS